MKCLCMGEGRERSLTVLAMGKMRSRGLKRGLSDSIFSCTLPGGPGRYLELRRAELNVAPDTRGNNNYGAATVGILGARKAKTPFVQRNAEIKSGYHGGEIRGTSQEMTGIVGV